MRCIALFFLIMPTWLVAQNLVLNPSFEDTTTTNYNVIYPICEYWFNPNASNSDYASPLWQELCCNNGANYGTPFNYLGYQNAQDGGSYIGLDIYESTSDVKDYAQGSLSVTLVAGEQYCVEIWLNLADSTGFSTCDFQVCFASENMNDSTTIGSLNLTNCVEFDISDIDTSEWTLFAGHFTAQGGEQFIYLGSNTPNDVLDCVETFNQNSFIWNSTYVFVDMISVTANENCINSVPAPLSEAVLSLAPNPFVDRLTISYESMSKREVGLYDMLGREVISLMSMENLIHLNTEHVAAGNYILRILDDKVQSIQVVQKN